MCRSIDGICSVVNVLSIKASNYHHSALSVVCCKSIRGRTESRPELNSCCDQRRERQSVESLGDPAEVLLYDVTTKNLLINVLLFVR